jgi:hypothetical protein
MVKKQRSHRVYRLTRSLKHLGKSVGRRSRNSIVNQVIKDDRMQKKVVTKVGNLIFKELVKTSLRKSNSLFGKNTPSAVENFKWSDLSHDLKRTMPTFFTIMNACTPSKPETKDMIIAVLGGIVIKNHNEKLNFIQRLISVLLYASHCPKMVRIYTCTFIKLIHFNI